MDNHVKSTDVLPFQHLKLEPNLGVFTPLMQQLLPMLLHVDLDNIALMPINHSQLQRSETLLVLHFLLLQHLSPSTISSLEMFAMLQDKTLVTKEHALNLFVFPTMPLELHAELTLIAELDFIVT
jgi:hypothetical protein